MIFLGHLRLQPDIASDQPAGDGKNIKMRRPYNKDRIMLLYHTSDQEIREPDIRFGRKNADFGQGFYLTDDEAFACRWAKPRDGRLPVLNIYELDTEGIKVHTFARDAAWFAYIYDNRRLKPDRYPEADIIIGPIANDTLYDTLGIMTSGYLGAEEAMQLLMIGPAYRQIVLKTERAAGKLHFLSARELLPEETEKYAGIVADEEKAYQLQLAGKMEEL